MDEYWNQQKKNIEKYFDLKKNYTIQFVDNQQIAHIFVDGKLKMKVEYDFVGIYNIMCSIWTWAWNVAFIDLKLSHKSLEIIKYYDKLDGSKIAPKELERLQYLLTNGSFFVTSKNIDRILRLALYIIQSEWILPIPSPVHTQSDQSNHVEYISIRKILQTRTG